MPSPPPITQHVYHEHLARFGEADVAHMYDASTAPPGTPLPLEQVLVLGWRPRPDLEISTFATVGMSSRRVPGASYRLELHFSIQGRLDERLEGEATRFLANLASYPWDHQCALDWWHTLRNVGGIPGYPGCSAVLFHPRFVDEGWDTVPHEDGTVRLLNVVPITGYEHALAVRSRQRLLEHWTEHDVWLFSDRSDPG